MSAFLQAAKAMKNKDRPSSSETTSTTRIEMPFNLDEIFQSDMDRFAKLKDVLKFFLTQMEKTNSRVTEIDIKMQSKFMEISQLKDKSEKIDKEIVDTKMICKALEVKSNEAEENLQELRVDSETVMMNKILADGRFKTLKAKVQELEEAITNIGNRS